MPGLAHAKQQTLAAASPAPNTATLHALLQAIGAATDADVPHTLAVINALYNRQLGAYLPHFESAPETVVHFDTPQRIGMVGYFAPLVPILVRAGHSVHCVERDRQYWQSSQDVLVGPDHSTLHHCDTVLCTATVLLNDSLAVMRDAAQQCTRFVLLGPSVPLAPRCLEPLGVTHLAGRHVSNASAFWSACDQGRDWSEHTNKFLFDIKKAPSPPGESALN